jgi:hypothetical protein
MQQARFKTCSNSDKISCQNYKSGYQDLRSMQTPLLIVGSYLTAHDFFSEMRPLLSARRSTFRELATRARYDSWNS